MKTHKLRKVTGFVIALIMAISFMAQPLVVFADTYDADEYLQSDVDGYPAESDEYQQQSDDVPFSWFDFFPELRAANLTEEARAIALEDFDYLVDMILQAAPTRFMFYRVFGVSMEDYFAHLRLYIYYMEPIPSFTAWFMDEDRWADEPTDDRMIAADYLMSLLVILAFQTGGFGHLSPQPQAVVEQFFFASAYILQNEEITEWLEEWGEEYPEWARFHEALLQFQQVHHDIYNTPSVLWFYDIDPSEFDFDVDLSEVMGFMDEDNLTINIIEPGKIAYLHIASFMNNMEFDSEVLFPFFEEIQNYEHLIIDIRGNGGGFPAYFTSLVVSMLIDESISFSYPEFFIVNELTASLTENPHSLAIAELYGMFPAAEFVRDQNMTQFNRDDLAILDMVAVWNVVYYPSEDAIPFGGEIWLLVDEWSASASVMAAKISVNTGFATVVGEPTSRVTGVVYTFAALPTTGIIFRIDLGYTTDMYGRSIEEFGVIPQIPNWAGMDALETVLAIIAGYDEPVAVQEEFPTRYFDGVAFMRLRDVADIIGVDVQWDGPNQSVIVTAADGSTMVIVVSTYGVINYGGRVYVPVENIEYIFAKLFA